MAKKRRKKKSSLIKSVGKLLPKALLVGLVLGGYYLYQNPQILPEGQVLSSQSESEESSDVASNFSGQQKVAEILGKTTSLLEEGLETIKIPKQLSGLDEEVVIQDAFDQFTNKIKDLPEQQVDRVKVQLCEDILDSVENASVVVQE